jgi:elongation factor G
VLLEPVVELTAVVPADDVGGVLGDLLARRGRVEGTANGTAGNGNGNGNGAMVTVAGIVPLAELFGYATALRGRTHGRGTFSTRPAGYAPTAR